MRTPKEWLSAVAALDRDPRFGAEPSTTSALARKVLISLEDQQSPFLQFVPEYAEPPGNRFYAVLRAGSQRANSKPTQARLAEEMRDSLLQFAVVAGLRQLELGPVLRGMRGIVKAIVRGVRREHVTPTLQPARQLPTRRPGYRSVDFALSGAALAFFNEYLQKVIATIDDEHAGGEDRVADITGGPFRPTDDPMSLQRWSRAWTSAVLIETLDWLRHTRCFKLADEEITVDALLRGFWSATRGGLKAVQFNQGEAPALPTGRPHAQRLAVALALRTVMAQALCYEQTRWAASGSATSLVRFRMRALDIEYTGKKAYFWGRNIAQIRFAILAECLLGLAAAEPEDQVEPPVEPDDFPPSASDASATAAHGDVDGRSRTEEDLAPAQQRCLLRIKTLQAAVSGSSPPSSDGMRDAQRFMTGPGSLEDELSLAMEASSHSGSWWYGDVNFVPPSDEPADSAGDQALGTLSLPMHSLPGTSWLDLTCIVQRGGRDLVLPVQLEAIESEEAASEVDEQASDAEDLVAAPSQDGGVCSLTDEVPNTHRLVLLDALPTGVEIELVRKALADPYFSGWAYERAGLGAFVVAWANLDQASPAG